MFTSTSQLLFAYIRRYQMPPLRTAHIQLQDGMVAHQPNAREGAVIRRRKNRHMLPRNA